ncbi:MAG TPA: ribosome recycling factor [Gammaproteobacteria bacterium]|nr:ribosome recycling factor [Gammaproteobacteria bacterium]
MIEEILDQMKSKFQTTLDVLDRELMKLRTGRAHPSLLNGIQIDYYGAMTPLSQTANVNVEDVRTLVVVPWDKSMSQAIEKAIRNAGLGLNPSNHGDLLRVPMPLLTEERRKDLLKVVRQEAEKTRVSIRNARRAAMQDIKELEAEKLVTEDDVHRCGQEIQKLTDQCITKIDARAAEKEVDLLKV